MATKIRAYLEMAMHEYTWLAIQCSYLDSYYIAIHVCSVDKYVMHATTIAILLHTSFYVFIASYLLLL